MPPGFSEAARRIPQYRVSVAEESRRDIARARLAAGVAVNQRDERKWSGPGWDLEPHIEQRLVYGTPQKPIANPASVDGWSAIELVPTRAGEHEDVLRGTQEIDQVLDSAHVRTIAVSSWHRTLHLARIAG